MSQTQASIGYPTTLAGTSATCTFAFHRRQTEGSGTFSTTGAPTTLALVFPNGRTDLTTAQALVDAVINHVLNDQTFTGWWNPTNTTPEAALRAALDSWRPLSFANPYSYVWFDGQFGPVLVS